MPELDPMAQIKDQNHTSCVNKYREKLNVKRKFFFFKVHKIEQSFIYDNLIIE